MTREEIKNTPELVDFMLDKCVLADSRTKVRKRLEEVCDLAIKALEQKLCEDVVKKDCDKCAYYDNGANNEACDECFADEYEHPNFKPKAQPCNDCISRQAVLDKLNRLIEVERLQGTDEMGYGRERVSAYESMIFEINSKYLYPSINPQEPCDDCISRQAVLDAINTYDKFGYTETGCFVREPEGDYVPYIHYDDVIKCIKNAPPVTPKEKTGKWINDEFGSKCSCCGIHTHLDKFDRPMKFKYCSMCGARMIEP